MFLTRGGLGVLAVLGHLGQECEEAAERVAVAGRQQRHQGGRGLQLPLTVADLCEGKFLQLRSRTGKLLRSNFFFNETEIWFGQYIF